MWLRATARNSRALVASHQSLLLRCASSSVEPKWMDKILIANRGEIACRIMHTAKKLGVKTVAVYSEADANSMHVAMADEAILIGPAASSESYLKMGRIIDAAKSTGAKGIHPGYGFLSENADFANLCQDEGLVFIGPPASAISSMGSKSESKNIMAPSGVPVVPGYHGEEQDPAFLLDQAKEIGFPVLIKAVKGGGGKGMRVVMKEADFYEALDMAKAESMKHFADDRVLIERYVQRPRHVEVQVFADQHGNAVHLFERDCSLQRRHQKVIEEAPAPGLLPATRQAMGDAAVRAALAVGYQGAGTVEFIMDTVTQDFFFMEMNTRLQVEHPVTEMVTNTDLVEWQLRVASGYPLPLTQDQLQLDGHSFEARIYAENPSSNFLPGSGPLKFVRTPAAADDVRIETGVAQGDEVTVHYDPMIAKLVVKGKDRDQALNRLRYCLTQYNIAGLSTNLDFLHNCASHPSFIAGDVTTDFIPDFEAELLPQTKAPSTQDWALAAALRYLLTLTAELDRALNDTNVEDVFSPWSLGDSFSVNVQHPQTSTLLVDELEQTVQVLPDSEQSMTVTVGDVNHHVELISKADAANPDDDSLFLARVDGRQQQLRAVLLDDGDLHVFGQHGHTTFSEPTAEFLAQGGDAAAGNVVTAPMTGTVVKVMVEPGDEVEEGQVVATMEAMKMELVLRAPFSGKIEGVNAAAGEFVSEAAAILSLEMPEDTASA
eukprot:TRINITY_DN6172_c0_g1_i1.p1 TRINITY_DN6172_c0_g1~~TRINITY_DN6172_c0_g1_i1.p1  ORF type:complete len:718 (+),score=204.55 TRINITY_DN6172_c0_g1_i1:122-2275(+)